MSMFLRGEFEDGGVAAVLIIAAFVVFAALFAHAGGGMAYGWITGRRDHLVIADNGVRHFDRLAAWEDIGLFSAGSKKKGEWMLFFQKKALELIATCQ